MVTIESKNIEINLLMDLFKFVTFGPLYLLDLLFDGVLTTRAFIRKIRELR